MASLRRTIVDLVSCGLFIHFNKPCVASVVSADCGCGLNLGTDSQTI